jgi:photosystem II stability/assembly factor-like uncharacterized protein
MFSSVVFAQVPKEYQTLSEKLKKDGWHRKEVQQLVQTHLQSGAGLLTPKPNHKVMMDIHHIQFWADQYKESYSNFQKTHPETHAFYEIKSADKIEPGLKINREPGVWKHVEMYATCGRIYDLELHPINSKVMYANPDGDGIFKTIDGGFSWKSVTDNIPDRLHRDAYENIIVDPANFDHLFSISRYGNMYETKDAGKTWKHVVNTNHKDGRAPQFKWVEATRNKNNQLVLIGSVTKPVGLNHGWKKAVYRSVDAGKTWEQVALPDEKFQEMAFHKADNNLIYLGSTSKLYVSKDAGVSFELLKDFEYGQQPMFITTCRDKNPDALYVVLSKGQSTKVYFSNDLGKSWEKRQDTDEKLGYEKGIFGGGGSSGWISFFEVDPFDSNHLIASTVGSCESFDGGRSWEYQAWHKRANAQMPDGSRPLSPHGSHNADNHCLKFHPTKQGFKVKGCDAGIMMKEKKDTNWVNINGDMPAFLWYSVVVNDFGERYIAGNTQDVNIQTYRYNKWENDRGYEGDAIFMNPSTNTTYFPVALTEKGEGLNFLEPGMWKMHSWSYPKVAVNYKNLDQIYIAYGRRPTEPEPQLPKYLYVTNDRGVTFKRVPNLDKVVYSVNLSRTKEQVLTVFTNQEVMSSVDGGNKWKIYPYPSKQKMPRERLAHKRVVSGCVNPNNPKQLWLGGNNGEVFSSLDGGESWTSMKGSLPDAHISEIVFHEGTVGDLYVLIDGYGVFYRSAKDSDWKLWMKGYNSASFTEIRIDYPTQKLIASSYGRGLWEADLEQTVDRFYNGNLKIVNKKRVAGKFVFTIDSDLQTPDYYNYTWFLNNKVVGNDKVLLLDEVKKGDKIDLTLSPIYSIDVQQKASLEVKKLMQNEKLESSSESLMVNSQYLNAGIVDCFDAQQDFTFGVKFKPETSGVIAANRRTYYRDAKGWFLEVTKYGKLHLNAAFYQNRSLDKTYGNGPDQSLSIYSKDGDITFNEWVEVAFNISRRSKTMSLYLNNELVGSLKFENGEEKQSLNSVMDLTFFADTYGKRPMTGLIDKAYISTQNRTDVENITGSECIYFIDFDDKIDNCVEIFTGQKIRFVSVDKTTDNSDSVSIFGKLITWIKIAWSWFLSLFS